MLYESLNSNSNSEKKRKTAAELEGKQKYQFYGSILSNNAELLHESAGDPSIDGGSVGNNLSEYFGRLPFYCGRLIGSNACCFNHAIGLPKKDEEPKQLFDYEINIHNLLMQGEKYIWIKKATGLGITEFFLRWIAWSCFTNVSFKNSNVCIVTGPNIELATRLIRRLKSLFEDLLTFNDKETVINLNGVHIEAFPSHHLAPMRGLTDVKFILIDEADFFGIGLQEEVRSVSERYIAKSDPYIVMVSTPNAPGGLFEKMEKDPSPDFRYKRLFLDYTVGLDKIYALEEIEEARKSPSFEREYNLSYGFGIGNVFLPTQLDSILIEPNRLTDIAPQTIAASTVSVGCDPGFGSSKFSYVVTALIDGRIFVLDAKEYERADFNDMVEVLSDIMQLRYPQAVCFIDGANPSFIRSLKLMMGGTEDAEYERVLERAKHDKINPGYLMRVLPVNFHQSGKEMLTLLQQLVSGSVLLISQQFDSLITQMRVARTKPDGNLDKDISVSSFDSFDALRLSCKNWHYQQVT